MRPPRNSLFRAGGAEETTLTQQLTSDPSKGMPQGQTPRGKGRPKTSSDATRRGQILEVTARLFVEEGYQGVTMAKVAAVARISLSTLYKLFANKTELFAAVVETHRRSMIDLPGDYDELPLAEALGRIFWIDIDAEAERWRSKLVNMMIVESQRTPELAPLFHEGGPGISRALLADWLERQRAAGRLRLADPAIAAKMLMDVAFGIPAPNADGSPTSPDSAQRAAYLRACFTMIVEGLAPR